MDGRIDSFFCFFLPDSLFYCSSLQIHYSYINQQIYPDEGHFLHSEGTQQHLSQSLVNFFEECFREPEIPTEEQQEDNEEDS